jgi:uncharacterized membrane protein
MKGELRKGIARTTPFLLSHHPPSERDRCHRVTLRGREVHLCARCSGIYPGIVAGLLFPVTPLSLWLVAVLPFPALVDWAVTTFRHAHDSNAVRTVTGLSLGYGYGLGLLALFGEGRVAVVLIGVGYGSLAAALLYLDGRVGT